MPHCQTDDNCRCHLHYLDLQGLRLHGDCHRLLPLLKLQHEAINQHLMLLLHSTSLIPQLSNLCCM